MTQFSTETYELKSMIGFIERLQMRIGELERRIEVLEEQMNPPVIFTISDEEGTIQ